MPIITFKGLPVDDVDEFVFGLENEIENSSKTFCITIFIKMLWKIQRMFD